MNGISTIDPKYGYLSLQQLLSPCLQLLLFAFHHKVRASVLWGAMAVLLTELPSEVVLRIFSHLQIPDLLQASRTCHTLHLLACDPILHTHRLRYASMSLSAALEHRLPKSKISPPQAWILLSKTNVISRRVSKSFIQFRLSRKLQHRPSVEDLIARAILPSSCANYSSPISPVLIQSHRALERSRLKAGLVRKLQRRPSVASLVSLNIIPEECVNRMVSPAILATRKRVIKEQLKDGLRAWTEGRMVGTPRKRFDDGKTKQTEFSTVRAMVNKFASLTDSTDWIDGNYQLASRKAVQSSFTREDEISSSQKAQHGIEAGSSRPPRTNVRNLSRFWEGVIRTAGSWIFRAQAQS